MTLGFSIAVITACANLVLGLFTYYKNPKSASHILLTILTVIIAAWSITNYFSLNASTPSDTLFWIRIVMAVTAPLGPVIFLLVHTFPQNVLKLSRGYLAAIVLWSIALAALSFTPLIFSRVEIIGETITPVPGPAIPLFALTFIGFSVSAFVYLVKKYRHADGLLKLQLRYFLVGILITFSLEIAVFIGINVLHVSWIVAIGPLMSLILVGCLMYAIVKHRLMDIRMVVARAVSYTLLTTIIFAIYGGVLYFIGNLFLESDITFKQFGLFLGVALLLAFTFSSLRGLLERYTDSFLFQENYAPEEFLSRISYILSINLELTNLTKKVAQDIKDTLHVEGVLFIFNEEKNKLLLENLKRLSSSVSIFEELPEGAEKDYLRSLEIGAAVRLQEQKKLVGYLLLGYKKTGGLFTNNDVTVLNALGPQLAIAIGNAQRYEEIERFSLKLKKEILEATHELRETNSKLKEIDIKKNEFISMAAHELRAPLTAVRGFLSMVIDGDTGPINEKTSEFLRDSLVSSERMIRLVNNMLDVGRIEEGRLTITLSDFSLSGVAKSVHAEFQGEAMSRQLEFRIDRPDELVDSVYADEDKVHEVIVNLVSNAIKYTEHGSVIVKLSNPNPQNIRLEVIDTGMGITDEEQKKLFKKFYRVQSNVGKTIGTGLGLYISKLLILRFGGTIGLNSVSGKGSTFWFELPVKNV